MGSASKACSVILRTFELISAAIVAGILGHYLHHLSDANAHANSRIIYAEVIAGISILFSLLLFPPLKYSFYFFGLDFALFICWMVAFGLLVNLTISGGCHSYWYWNYWGYYWGGYWRTIPRYSLTQSIVGTAACSDWRATIAFAFIGGWFWIVSGFLGIYVITKTPKDRPYNGEKSNVPMIHKISRLGRKPKSVGTGIPVEYTTEANNHAAESQA